MTDDRSVFAKVNANMLQGLMLHDQLYRLFLFLRLYTFADIHKKQYRSEDKNYKKLNKYFITHRNMFIEDTRVNASDIIPMEWYKRTRFDVTPDDIKKSVNYAISVWVEWEKKSKELYTDAYNKLIELGFAAESDYVLSIVKDVDKELAEAESLQLRLAAIEYNVIEIMAMN